ncbi:bestrophin-like domain [Bradyrhizobium sp. CCBAU 11386]|uniref:bestrophin-like domain n=1 Tax=Bradyrhizobium sp. CCBAU 11386 TaxID=1630837 RepID=UPI002303896B|nr:hypothetical protein [Bradyrhizobium sp. CCBAU 11386]
MREREDHSGAWKTAPNRRSKSINDPNVFFSFNAVLQAACALLVIGLVHCDNSLGSAIAMGLFATRVATSVLLIAAHDRPFAGQISIQPEPLLQIMPEAAKS